MLPAIAAGGAAALAALALTGCGHQATAGTSRDSATLATYVMDTDCSNGQDAYRVLVFLVSADTGTPVRQILDGLRAGRSLDDIAGARSGQVRTQATGMVQAWLQFAEANGRLTAEQAEQYGAAAAVAIDALMAANVSSCVPAALSRTG
jgi:hypothetical protein